MIVPDRLNHLLKNPVFRRVWLAGGCVGVARWLEMLVVGVFAFDATGSAFLVAFLVIMRLAPLAIFGPLVGAFADRLPPRLFLLCSLTAATLVSLTVALLFTLGLAAYWHVALATFASGLIWTTDMPLRRTILGDVAGPDRIAPAMSLDSATNNATRMLGPLLGGLLYEWLGTGGAFALSATLYALAALMMLAVPSGLGKKMKREDPAGVLRDLREAVRFVARDRDILRILLVTVVFNIWGFPFVSMIPVIGSDDLSLSAGWIGVLAALEGGGALIGALTVAVSVRPGGFRKLYYFGTVGYLLLVFVTGWMSQALPMAATLFLVGTAGACFASMQSTLIYSLAPPEMRGRLFGLLVLCIGTGLIGFTNIGLMGEWFGGSAAIRIVAAEGLIPILLLGIGWRQLWGR